MSPLRDKCGRSATWADCVGVWLVLATQVAVIGYFLWLVAARLSAVPA